MFMIPMPPTSSEMPGDAAEHQGKRTRRFIRRFQHLRLVHNGIGAVILIFLVKEALNDLLRLIYACGIDRGNID